MTAFGGGDEQGRGSGQSAASASVLADRMAAALVHHEPGWRLPRFTALARRYNVSASEVEAAIGELAARHLVRRLPDGQVYRASPAEYLVPLEGVTGLRSYVDPMGGQLACKTRHTSRRRPPEDIARSLRLSTGESTVAIRCLWTVGDEPAALSASYLTERLAATLENVPETPAPADPGAADATQHAALAGAPEAAASAQHPAPARVPGAVAPLLAGEESAEDGGSDQLGGAGGADEGDQTGTDDGGDPPGRPGTVPEVSRAAPSPGGQIQVDAFPFPWGPGAVGARQPSALQIELGLPPPSVARSLRLAAGEPVATLTAIFADPVAGSPALLTMTMLRPALFRVVLETQAELGPAGSGAPLPSARALLPAELPSEES